MTTAAEHQAKRSALAGVAILFANNYPGDSFGGGEVQLLALIDTCVAAGMQVEVACQPGSAFCRAAAEHGAHTHEVDFAPARLASAIKSVRELAESTGARIVQGTGFLTNVVTRRAVREMPVALVNVAHVEPGAARYDGGSRTELSARKLADRATIGRVDRVVAVSQAVADGVARQYKVDPSTVTVIRNGLNAEAVRAAAAVPLGIGLLAHEVPLVGMVARLEAVKGVTDFVRAAAPVLDCVPDARFAIAGTGSLESQLYTVAAAVDVSHRLSLLGHVKPVEPFMAALDVFVMASLSEGLPMAALEAMALGRPVVATRVGGLPEVVVDGVTGLLVPAGDPAALGRAIVTLLADPERAAAMGEAGRERVEREFTLERMGREYLELYAELLGGVGRAAGARASRSAAIRRGALHW